jgi:hypothetical protein
VAGEGGKPYGLPNVTPAPKLNRYAESAVLTFIVNETKMLAARTLEAYEKSPKVSEVPH